MGVKAGWIDTSVRPAIINKGYRFFADFPTNVPDTEGAQILAQNKNLIAEWTEPIGPQPDQVGQPGVDEMALMDTVHEISKLKLENLRLVDLIELGNKIGITILNNQAKKLAINRIESRCQEIVDTITAAKE